jgi:hypothetical protein
VTAATKGEKQLLENKKHVDRFMWGRRLRQCVWRNALSSYLFRLPGGHPCGVGDFTVVWIETGVLLWRMAQSKTVRFVSWLAP